MPFPSRCPVSEFTTIEVGVEDFVLTVTLNRPHRLGTEFDEAMCNEFERLWKDVSFDDGIRAVVVRAAGERAFSTGVDVAGQCSSRRTLGRIVILAHV